MFLSVSNLKGAREPNPDKWADFVYNHPNGNIFQTPDMYQVYKHKKNYEPIISYYMSGRIF